MRESLRCHLLLEMSFQMGRVLEIYISALSSSTWAISLTALVSLVRGLIDDCAVFQTA